MGALDLWDCCGNLAQLWWTRHGGVPTRELAAHRLAALVEHARGHSPLYRELYAGLAPRVRLEELPVVRKPQLMARFDEWTTDERVRREDVLRFLATRPVGERFLGEFLVWKSSGTSGLPGLFVQDPHAAAVYDALVAQRFQERAWSADVSRIVAGGARSALVAANHDHFAGIVSWEHARRAYPAGEARSFSVLEPLPRLVASLNAFHPSFLAAYPSVLALLAQERAADRLAISPALLWSGGEHLAPRVRARIEQAFGAPLQNEYGASECLSIAASCTAGALHVHEDWVLLEAVDREMRPVAPGTRSHTVLLTNLANWVQPVIRYDLGDRIVVAPGNCPCGSASPAIEVEGRTDDTLRLTGPRGRSIALVPLALATVVEDATGTACFQVVQTAPHALALRLSDDALRAGAWKRAEEALRGYLDAQCLENVALSLAQEAPRRDRASGKLPTVVARWKG